MNISYNRTRRYSSIMISICIVIGSARQGIAALHAAAIAAIAALHAAAIALLPMRRGHRSDACR